MRTISFGTLYHGTRDLAQAADCCSLRQFIPPPGSQHDSQWLGGSMAVTTMDYITSRSFVLPKNETEMSAALWFNLWVRASSIQRELIPGDRVYWYETPSQALVWETTVRHVGRTSYIPSPKSRKAGRKNERPWQGAPH